MKLRIRQSLFDHTNILRSLFVPERFESITHKSVQWYSRLKRAALRWVEGWTITSCLEAKKRKRIKNSDAFPVEVRIKEEAIELSLAENFQREDIHPADSIRAFLALRDTGMDAEEIAARFGQAVSYVYKMLRLSALAPALIDLLAKESLGDGISIRPAALSASGSFDSD